MKQVLTITLKRQQNGRGNECDGERADGAAASSESKPLMGEEEDRLGGGAKVRKPAQIKLGSRKRGRSNENNPKWLLLRMVFLPSSQQPPCD